MSERLPVLYHRLPAGLRIGPDGLAPVRQMLREHQAAIVSWRRQVQELLAVMDRLVEEQRRMIESALRALDARAGGPEDGQPASANLRRLVQDYERALVLGALARTNGEQKRAALLLGVLPTTLHERMKRLGLRTRMARAARRTPPS